MPEATFVHRAFNGGELSPWAEGRTDLTSYRSASRRIENLIPTPQGSLVRRPGTRYLRTLTGEYRMHPFVVSRSDAYIVLLGDYEMRFIREGGVLNYSDVTVHARSVNIVADQIEYEGHGFYHGQKIQLLSTGGAPTGLATSTDYYVSLPRAIRCTQQVGATYTTIAAAHGLNVQMGPYQARADTNNSVDAARDFWIAAIPAVDEITLTQEKGGSAPSVATGSAGFVTLIPAEMALTDTFRLATDPTDLEGTVINITARGTGPHVFGTVADEEVVIRTPWSLAQAWELDIQQDESTLFFFHKDFRPCELRRYNTSAFRLILMQIDDGPYGDVAPAGNGVQLSGNTTLTNPLDYHQVAEFESEGGYFKGTHVGTYLRKGYEVTASSSLNKSLIGRIERLSDHYAQFGPLGVTYVDAPNGSGNFDATSHPFTTDEPVCFVTGDGEKPDEIEERTVYYAIDVGANEVGLAATAGGAAIVMTDPGSGTAHKLISLWMNSQDEDGAAANHGLSTGDDWAGFVALGELPEGLYEGTAYVIVSVDANTLYVTDRDGVIPPVTSEGHGRFFLSAGEHAAQVMVRLSVDPRSTGVASATANGPTLEWYDSAWSAYKGWPAHGIFHQQRLLCAGTNDLPETVWASVVGATTDFNFDERQASDIDDLDRAISDASGFAYRLLGGQTGEILWMYQGQGLLIGAKNALASLAASTNREALTPANTNAEIRQRSGVSATFPVDALGDAIFESQARKQIQAAVFDGQSGSFAIDDINLLAEHTSDAPVLQFAWQAEPYGIVYALRTDGTLWQATYSARQGLAAWHRTVLGGTDVDIESIGVIPQTDDHSELYDRLYLITTRTIDDETVRFIEYLDSPLRPGHADESAYYVDAGIVYSGVSTATITGLDHLEGETVRIWADGAAQQDKVVASGQITIDTAATEVSVGLPFASIWESLPFETALESQTTIQGLRSRLVDAQLRLYRSVGGEIGPRLTKLYDIDYRRPGHAMDTPIPLFTGILPVEPGAGHGNEATLALRVDTASPFHLVAIMARIEWVTRS